MLYHKRFERRRSVAGGAVLRQKYSVFFNSAILYQESSISSMMMSSVHQMLSFVPGFHATQMKELTDHSHTFLLR